MVAAAAAAAAVSTLMCIMTTPGNGHITHLRVSSLYHDTVICWCTQAVMFGGHGGAEVHGSTTAHSAAGD